MDQVGTIRAFLAVALAVTLAVAVLGSLYLLDTGKGELVLELSKIIVPTLSALLIVVIRFYCGPRKAD